MSSNNVIPFSKYHGLGNDFILIDNRISSNPIFTSSQAMKLCNRNYGIGADGVIFVLSSDPDTHTDFTMKIYNSDGSEPQMCGNGIRCLAKYLANDIEKKPSGEEVIYRIWTNAGLIIPRITNDGRIEVDMGNPILDSLKVPTTLKPTRDNMAIESELIVNDEKYRITCVSMGNPHAVSV